jgi:predicted phosphodiesterase
MSKVLLISDVHGNNAALKAVLDYPFDYLAYTDIWCLGDVVGYGPVPYHVWLRLHRENIPAGNWLAGNHDWGLLGKLPRFKLIKPDPNYPNGFRLGNFRDKAWNVLQVHIDMLQYHDELHEHIDGLPVMSSPRAGVYLTHGAFDVDPQKSLAVNTTMPFFSPSKYVEKFEELHTREPTLAVRPHKHSDAPPRLFATGHSHTPGIWRWNSQSNTWEQQPLESQPLGNLESSPLFVNPGAVSAFRDVYGCASFMLIDWDTEMLFYQRIPYNYEWLYAQMNRSPYRALRDERNFLIEPACS